MIVILFISFTFLNAQNRTIDVNTSSSENYLPQSGDYLKNDKYDDYVGEFSYSNNGKVFKMKLERKIFYYKVSDTYYDRMFGSFEYIKNQTEIVKSKNIIQKEKISLDDLKNNSAQITSSGLLDILT